MFFNKRLNTGHSQRINWLWPFVILVLLALFFLFGKKQSPTLDMDKPSDFWVRILLFNDIKSCKISSAEGFTVVTDAGGNIKFKGGKKYEVICDSDSFKIGDGVFEGKEITIKPESPFVFTINNKEFRGNLVLSIDENLKFDAINHVPMEAYVASVVGAEMPRYWHNSALKAQAVASRTYCLYYKGIYGSKRNYDVKRTQASQVYKGIASEYKSSVLAARYTIGQVMYDGNDLFPAFFSSSCGGNTEDANYVFGKDFNTLKAKPCPYCEKVAKKKQFHWKPVQYTSKQIWEKLSARYEKVKQLKAIKDIQVRRKSDFGQYSRITSFTLIGKNNKKVTIRGEDLRLAIDSTGRKIKSTIFEFGKVEGKWVFFSGRGFGHGVGMCQCGAQALARDGYSYQHILNYYYNNPKMVKLYE